MNLVVQQGNYYILIYFFFQKTFFYCSLKNISSSEGSAIAFAVLEQLAQIATCSFTMFVTHFSQLHSLESLYSNIRLCHTMVEERNGILSPRFAIGEGASAVKHYGVELAAQAGLPSSMYQFFLVCFAFAFIL